MPGGPKRKEREINDYGIQVNKYGHSNMSKFIKDFRSQVTCLPGPVKNNYFKETGKLLNEKSYEKSDIFFFKKNENNFQNQSEKKKKIFIRNTQSSENDVYQRKSIRPEHAKNFIESQIFN